MNDDIKAIEKMGYREVDKKELFREKFVYIIEYYNGLEEKPELKWRFFVK